MKELLDLRYQLSYSISEIALRVGRSEGWVRTALCRIRQQLRASGQGNLSGEIV